MARTAGWIVACAAAPTLIACASIWFLNDLSLSDAAVVTLWLWPVFTCVFAGQFVGASRPVTLLPRFGVHGIWMLGSAPEEAGCDRRLAGIDVHIRDLMVANTGATGYGGVVDVRSVAPTILSLLRLPIATDMQPPIADVTATWGTTTAYDGLRRDFVLEEHLVVDPERRELLRSLGYLSGQ